MTNPGHRRTMVAEARPRAVLTDKLWGHGHRGRVEFETSRPSAQSVGVLIEDHLLGGRSTRGRRLEVHAQGFITPPQ